MTHKDTRDQRPAFVRHKHKHRYVCERRWRRNKSGVQLVVEAGEHNYCSIEFRELYETPRGGQGNKRIWASSLNRHEAVELASILFHLTETVLHDKDEKPYTLYLGKEKRFLTSDEICLEYQTAMERNERRTSRSHLYGLMRMFIERCEDIQWVEAMFFNLVQWSAGTGDAVVQTKTEQAMAQLGLFDPKNLDG